MVDCSFKVSRYKDRKGVQSQYDLHPSAEREEDRLIDNFSYRDGATIGETRRFQISLDNFRRCSILMVMISVYTIIRTGKQRADDWFANKLFSHESARRMWRKQGMSTLWVCVVHKKPTSCQMRQKKHHLLQNRKPFWNLF